MNRYIDITDADRLTVGVREWAVERILQGVRDGLIDRLPETEKPITVMGLAKELEEYVLRDIVDKGFQPEDKI